MIKTSLHANVFKATWDSGPSGLFFIARAQNTTTLTTDLTTKLSKKCRTALNIIKYYKNIAGLENPINKRKTATY